MVEINTEPIIKGEIDIPLRPMVCELNVLTRSDGSALLAQGETTVLASVSGPIEVKLQNLNIEKANIEVYYRPKQGHPGVSDRVKEQIIRNTCETALLTTLHPRTAISIQLQEMDDRGGLLACTINASCLALLNSALSMKFLIAAIDCIIDENNELILDPNHRQAKNSKANLTFVFDSVNKHTVTAYTTGIFTVEQYEEAQTVCREASKVIFNFYREMIKKYTKVL